LKKLITYLFLILLLTTTAKHNFAVTREKNPWYTKDMQSANRTFVEIFGGGIYSSMLYSDKNYQSFERNHNILQDYGLGIRFQFGYLFSVNPRIANFGQGISLKTENQYHFKQNMVGVFLPFEVQIPLKNRMKTGITKLFFYVAPYLSTPISGEIKTINSIQKPRASDMVKYNYGAEAGIGIRIPTFSMNERSNINIRASYMRGFNDTYSPFELDKILHPIGEEIYLLGGLRYNHGIKLTLSIELFLSSNKMTTFTAGGDGRKNFKRVIVFDKQ
jgi:hypothetical protein